MTDHQSRGGDRLYKMNSTSPGGAQPPISTPTKGPEAGMKSGGKEMAKMLEEMKVSELSNEQIMIQSLCGRNVIWIDPPAHRPIGSKMIRTNFPLLLHLLRPLGAPSHHHPLPLLTSNILMISLEI
jgi:hypothetical protein